MHWHHSIPAAWERRKRGYAKWEEGKKEGRKEGSEFRVLQL